MTTVVDRQCIATAKATGERCRVAAIVGGSVCWKHGGAAPQVRDAARRRLERVTTEGEVAALLAEIGIGTEDPHEILLEQVAHSAAMANLLRTLVAGLAPHHEPGNLGVDGRIPAALYGEDHLHDLRPHPLVVLLGEWTDRAARTSKVALAAGVAQPRIEVQVKEAKLLAAVVQGSVQELLARMVETAVAAGARRDVLQATAQLVYAESGPVVRRALVAATAEADQGEHTATHAHSEPVTVTTP